MDRRVLFSFILAILIGVFAVVYFMSNSCEPPVISVDRDSVLVNQSIAFSATNSEDPIRWNFGDSTVSEGAKTIHAFSKPGIYTVSAAAKGECVSTVKIYVGAARIKKKVIPIIHLPAGIIAGNPFTIVDETPEVESRKWILMETKDSSTSSSFSLLLQKPGRYHLQFSFNGDYVYGDSIFDFVIERPKPSIVTPVRPTPPVAPIKPMPVKPKTISDAEFAENFIDLCSRIMAEDPSASRDWDSKIAHWGCDQTMNVQMLSGSSSQEFQVKKLESFKTMLILSSKPPQVERVRVDKRSAGGCISQISVFIKK